jgi:hypothetical protein
MKSIEHTKCEEKMFHRKSRSIWGGGGYLLKNVLDRRADSKSNSCLGTLSKKPSLTHTEHSFLCYTNTFHLLPNDDSVRNF